MEDVFDETSNEVYEITLTDAYDGKAGIIDKNSVMLNDLNTEKFEDLTNELL